MAKGLRSFTERVMEIFKVVATITLFLLTFVILMQIIIRFTPITNIAWTEELSRFAFIWSSMFGAAVAYNRASFASITMVPNALKGKARWVFDFVVEILVFIVCIIIIVYGFQLSISSSIMKTTALHAPMWVQYVPVPIGGCGLALVSLTKIIELFSKDKKEEVAEGTAAEDNGGDV